MRCVSRTSRDRPSRSEAPDERQDLISVVVPLFDGRDVVGACLDSLAEQHGPLEVLVVDDDSSDDGASYVQQTHPWVQLHRLPSNVGFVRACRHGMRRCSGRWIAVLNQDAWVAPDWANELREAFASDHRIGLVGGVSRDTAGALLHVGGWLDARGQAHHVTDWPAPDEVDEGGCVDVEFATGACLAISRDAYEQCGGPDLAFAPAYFEDVDWCLRAAAVGWRVVVGLSVEYGHLEESRLADGSGWFSELFHRNRLEVVARHFRGERLLRFLEAEADAVASDGGAWELQGPLLLSSRLADELGAWSVLADPGERRMGSAQRQEA